MIKTFRGLIADGGQDIINLHTNDGKIGYRIVKFQLMFSAPGTNSVQHIVKIYKDQPLSIDGLINFSDSNLIGAGWLNGSTSATYGWNVIVTFDSEIFNQDIYITHSEISGSSAINYYIELEQMSLDLNEATVATLQSIRSA